jgi:peptide/nickel transport system substrate-binding protein
MEDPMADPTDPRTDEIATRRQMQGYLDVALSRRSLFKVAGFGAAAAFLAACSSTPATSAPTSAAASTGTATGSGSVPPASSAVASAATGGTPTKGGTFSFAPNSAPDSMDPHVASASSSIIILMNVVDTLVLKNPDDQKFYGYLADSWDVSADGKSTTFHLHPGVKFHDGTPFDAAAVKFNLDRIVNPATKSQYAVTLLGPYDNSTVVDPMTVTVNMKTPYPPLLDSLSIAACGMMSPTAVQAASGGVVTAPIGTGFMKFVSYTPNDSVKLTQNPDYNWAPKIWGHQGPAYLDGLTFPIVTDPAARVTALESGSANGIEDTPGQDVARLKADTKYTLIEGFIPGAPRGFFMNTEKAPLDDVNVRKALLYGMDRSQIIQLALFNVQPAAEGPFSPVTEFYTKKVEGLYPFDAAKAGSLLDAAGWTMGSSGVREKNGQPLKLTAIGVAAFQAIYTAAQSLYQKIGVQLDVQILDAAAATPAEDAGQAHLAMTGLVASDPSNIALFWNSKNYGGYDWSRIKDTDLDKMWDDAASSLDEATRASLYEQIQLTIMNNAWIYPVQALKRNNFVDANVRGIKQDSRGIYPWLYDTYIAAS